MEEATWTSDETQISFLRLTSTKHVHYLVLLTDTSVSLNLRLDLTAVRFFAAFHQQSSSDLNSLNILSSHSPFQIKSSLQMCVSEDHVNHFDCANLLSVSYFIKFTLVAHNFLY